MNKYKKLDELIERVRRIPITPEREEAFRRSSVYGSMMLEKPNITRVDIDRAAERLKNKDYDA